MKRIAITPTEIFDHEASYIVAILDAGWDYVHLRHPSATLRDMRRVIEALPQKYHRQLRLHGHFELINEFNLGGLHLNSRCPIAPENYSGSVSRTCHSLEDVKNAGGVDYVTLSPIFDSVSKVGYNAAFSKDELSSVVIDDKVVALGGVTPHNINELSKYEFIGYAVLGYLFNSPDISILRNRLDEFEK